MDVARSELFETSTPVACASCQARHGVVCGALSSGQLRELNRHSLRRKIEAGCEIIAQGAESSFYSNIMEAPAESSADIDTPMFDSVAAEWCAA